MKSQAKIIKFVNALGQVKYKFQIPSIFHPGQMSKSLNSWDSKSGAYKALKANSK